MRMNKTILTFLLSLLAVVPAFAQSHQPVGGSKNADGHYQYLDFAVADAAKILAEKSPVPQAVSITQEVVVDFQCLPNPGNPSSGNVRLYCDSGTGNLTCLTSTGASCLGGGGGGGGGATSVGLAGPTGIPISNSPVTTTGTLTWAMPTGWILGDMLVGNGANSVARLAGPTTPNSVPQVLTETPSGGIAQLPVFALPGLIGRTVAGTTDTILATDRSPQTVEYTSSSAVAVTVPDPGSAGFTQGPAFITFAEGAGAVTFTPQTSAVITYCTGAVCLQNQPTVTLTQGQYASWSSPSTANWLVRVYATGPSAAPIFNNQLFSGGGVVWTGLLNFTVSAANYSIAASNYTSPQTNLTLSAADPTNPRIDVIAVNASGAAVVITGTPAGSPSAPTVDPTTQLALTFVTVPANSTTPTLSNILVYDENLTPTTEWTCTPSANFNCNSTNNPYHGSKDIEVTTAVATNNVVSVNNATVNLSAYSTFGFYIRNKASWPNAKSLSICFKNGSTVVGNCVGFKNGVYGFDQANVASYQQIVIPLTAFGLGSTVVDRVSFTVVGGGASIGFYLDFMQLQSSTSGSGGGTPQFQLAVNGAGTAQAVNLSQGSNVTLTPSTTGGVTTVTVAASSSSPLSGMTATQVPIAATATTVTSSKAIQGSDASLLSSGTVSGTGVALCTDAQGGATTSGCSSGGVTSVGLSLPGIFTVTGSPVTTTGTLTGKLANENVSTGFLGPAAISNSNATLVQICSNFNANTGSGLTTTATCGQPITAGNQLIVMTIVRLGGATQTTVSDASDTFTKDVEASDAFSQWTVARTFSAVGGNTTVQMVPNGSQTLSYIFVMEYQGVTAFDVAAHTENNSATATASVTTTAANDLLIANPFSFATGQSNPDANFTVEQAYGPQNSFYYAMLKDAGTQGAGVYSASVNTTGVNTNSIELVAYKTSGVPVGTPSFRLMKPSDLPQPSVNFVYTRDQPAQVAAISDTTMFTVGAADTVYLFSGSINCTTTSAGAVATLNLKYTDTSSTAQTVSVSDTCTSLVATGVPDMVHQIRVKKNTAITYGVTITNTPTYDVSVRLSQL